VERFGQKGLTGPCNRPNPEGSMVNIGLLVLDQTAWARVATDPIAFADEHTLTLGVEPDFLHAAGQQTVACSERGAASPWTRYLAVDRSHQIIIGTCGFTAPPDAEGVVEIAYFTFPPLRVEVMQVRWRRELWNSRKALQESGCGLTRCRNETPRRVFWRSLALNGSAKLWIQRSDKCGAGNVTLRHIVDRSSRPNSYWSRPCDRMKGWRRTVAQLWVSCCIN
jgi:hypothetical protein